MHELLYVFFSFSKESTHCLHINDGYEIIKAVILFLNYYHNLVQLRFFFKLYVAFLGFYMVWNHLGSFFDLNSQV